MYRNTSRKLIVAITTAMVAALGQLNRSSAFSNMRIPTVRSVRPPSNCGVTMILMVMTKVKILPVTTPDTVNGNVIL